MSWSASVRLPSITCCRAYAAIFLAKLGRHGEACAEFKRAADLTRNERERTLLLARAAACAEGTEQ